MSQSTVLIHLYTLYFGFHLIALPAPNVTIVTDGLIVLGQQYKLECVVETVAGLIVQPLVTWVKYSGVFGSTGSGDAAESANVVAVVTGYVNTLNFAALHTSDAGLYVCTAILNINRAGLILNSSAESQLQLKSLLHTTAM